jgi:putative terminase ATPase subunit|nr:MAG TPA: large terminase [Caudoviricetes sp.]
MAQITDKAFQEAFGHVSEYLVDMISFFRKYPDYLLDYAKTESTMYDLTPFQRVYLRAFFRYKKVGIVATRGISKTYSNVLAHFLKCVLYPNNKLALAMPTKDQSARVVKEKIDEIVRDYPLLANEIDESNCSYQKDYVKIAFKNGSTLDTLTVGQSSRGLRCYGISMEEIVDERMNAKILNEVIEPIVAQPRPIPNFGADVENEYSMTKAYVTTAGTKQSYCYEKFASLFQEMTQGKATIVLGTSYEMGTYFGTLTESEVIDKKNDATYSPLAFDREYRSIFTGSSEGSLVSADELSKTRTLTRPFTKADDKDIKNPNVHYVLSYDVARASGKSSANSALVVVRIEDRGNGTYTKQLVNIFTQEGVHFENQAKFLKRKVVEYNARILCIDINGMGWGLVDYLTSEIDENPPYSIVNNPDYDQYKKPNSIPMIFAVNASSKETKNSNIINHFMSVVAKNDVKLLVSESQARSMINEMDGRKHAELSLPFIQTDRLVDEIMNLIYVNSGNTGTIKQVSTKIQKDRFSAFAYALYWIFLQEVQNKNKRRKPGEHAWKDRIKQRKPVYKRFT